jgi:single-strand DNA-binding protein
MNVLSFTGGLGRDCETRFTAKGDAVTSFSVALSSGYGDSKLTTWMNCTIFGKRGESLAPYLLKGAQVAISGEFAARPYTNKAGEEKLSLDVRVNDVTLMGGKQGNQSAPATNTAPAEFDDSETIPF